MSQRPFLEQLDLVHDEAEVRERLAKGLYSSQHKALAEEWLRREEVARAESAAERKEARDEESLSIARRALANSQKSTRIAVLALILSVVLAALKVIEWTSR